MLQPESHIIRFNVDLKMSLRIFTKCASALKRIWYRASSSRLNMQGLLRCFRDTIGVPRIENRVPRIRENRVPRIGEIGSLQVHTGHLTFSLKKLLVYDCFFSLNISVICRQTVWSKKSTDISEEILMWNLLM